MMHKKRLLSLFVIATILIMAVLVACGGAEPAAEATPCPEAEPCPDCPECPEAEVTVTIPFLAAWTGSGHADSEAEAFRHWDENDPAEVPTSCAKCHSSPGFLDFLGEDGTEAGVVDNAAPIDTVITCETCHNATTANLTSVVFPSGVEVGDLGASARCMQCHQGRESTVSVNDSIAELGLDEDAVSEELSFRNIHYYAAAATLFGGEAQGGYQYEGKGYQPRFAHVEGYQECVDCHSPHTLQVKIDECAVCHAGASSVEDTLNFRMQGSLADYDGDGDVSEGIYYEIVGLQEMLYMAIQDYAANVAGTPIVYDAQSHPYFFIDSNANGAVDEGEAVRDNQYNAFSPRLLKAAYNYQVSMKDPGAFAHNAKYVIALLYDSIESLNEKIPSPVDLSTASRNDPGHFDGSSEAFRHWDAEGLVQSRGQSCSKCHSADGLPFFHETGYDNIFEPANAFMCTTCHTFEEGIAVLEFTEVTFPSGAVLSFAEDVESNLCLNCHQGRESTVSVNAAIARAGVGDNEVSEQLRFANVHYFAAGATLFGTEAKGGYEFEGKTYVGQFAHTAGFDSCSKCHNVHALQVNVEACAGCHAGAAPHDIRMDSTDFDGDGDTTEGMAGELETMAEALYAAMQAYAEATDGVSPIVYDAHAYPYYFDDAGEGFATWTPALLRAAYNYQYYQKDPGAFAHNAKYVLQLLYDSIEALGGDVSAFTRPG